MKATNFNLERRDIFMKKIVCLLFVLMVFIGSVFAKDTYTVKEVKGTVLYEVDIDMLEKVEVDLELSPSQYVDVGVNSKLILEKDSEVIEIKTPYKGTILDYIKIKIKQITSVIKIASEAKEV